MDEQEAPPIRRPGRRKSNYNDESTADVVKNAKKQIGKNFGGKDAIASIINKMAERGVACGEKSAQAILEIIDEQFESLRRRVYPRLDEAVSRLEDKPITEELP